MRNIKKKVSVLLMAGVMMASAVISVYAGEESEYASVGSAIVKYNAGCYSDMGDASTWVTDSGESAYSEVSVSLKLYVLNTNTGAVSLYGSDSAEDSEFCGVEVYITDSDYTGHRVSSSHSVTVVNPNNTGYSTDSHVFTVYK